jgi:hypothetical protein
MYETLQKDIRPGVYEIRGEKVKKAYFQYYETFENIVEQLDDVQLREKFRKKIINYGLYGIIPEIDGSLEKMGWVIIKDLIDQQQHRREINRANRSGKKTEAKEKPAPRMEKPTLEEIKDYCREKGYNINAEGFYSYYESNGWKIGGRTAMKNWKAAVQSWAAREKKGGTLWNKDSTDADTEQYADMF